MELLLSVTIKILGTGRFVTVPALFCTDFYLMDFDRTLGPSNNVTLSLYLKSLFHCSIYVCLWFYSCKLKGLMYLLYLFTVCQPLVFALKILLTVFLLELSIKVALRIRRNTLYLG